MKSYLRGMLLLLMCSLTYANNLCQLAEGTDWQGWVKIGSMKFKGTGSAMHLFEDDYLITGDIPDLGIHETFQEACVDGVVKSEQLKYPIYLKRVGDDLVVDYAQDMASAHFEHKIPAWTLMLEKLGLK